MLSSVDYLGYTVTGNGIKAYEPGLEVIRSFPIPTKVHEVQSFIRLCSYFRRFIQDFSLIAKPLYDLTKKDKKFEFKEVELDAFNALKNKLIEAPILAIYDPRDETELHCDASSLGYGAILLQRKKDGKLHRFLLFKTNNKSTVMIP